ncbi:hypothetical protein SLS59_004150 [Nothophoma quercina]|uniref:Uncharacterized protein n=1 Tax=Nothophoma quercina TaxID=749835 RepID=A0ABR3RIZ2_9PLEO
MTSPATHLDHLLEFETAFSWTTACLRAILEAAQPGYNFHDPATWPRMTEGQVDDKIDVRSRLRTVMTAGDLLQGLAYDHAIARRYLAECPEPKTAYFGGDQGTSVLLSEFFYQFPYSFTPGGVLRVTPRLPSEDRDRWILAVTGSPAQPPHVNKPKPPSPPESSTEAFREVLAMMNKTPAAKVVSLEDKVEKLERELKEQQGMTNTYKKEYVAVRKRRDAAENEVKALRSQVTNLEQTLKGKNGKLEASKKETTDAKNEATETKQQVFEIWTRMEKHRRCHEQEAEGYYR